MCKLERLDTMQELSTNYDAEALESFFHHRQALVWQRLVTISLQFVLLYTRGLLRGGPSAALNPAPEELCGLLAALGPTFVKLGQTLSTREDLVGRDVARSLSALQMSAPPFDDHTALALVRSELGGELEDLYTEFPDKHTAAASLGQVYKALLQMEGDGPRDVAVKVQRPHLLGSIALDVYVLRMALGIVRKLARINSDIRAIADEVGRGLFAELDYTVEASQVRLLCNTTLLACWLSSRSHRH